MSNYLGFIFYNGKHIFLAVSVNTKLNSYFGHGLTQIYSNVERADNRCLGPQQQQRVSEHAQAIVVV